MPDYGVTPEGFLAKPFATIEDEVDAGLRVILGDAAGTDPGGKIPYASAAGQLKALLVDGFAAQWDLQEAVYSSRDPNQATDASQDAVVALSGTVRADELQSGVDVLCVGDPLTVLAVGRQLEVASTGERFSSNDEATIEAADAWVALTAYEAGDLVTNNGNVYLCTTAGTSDAAGGPSTTDESIADATVTWRFIGLGEGVAEVQFSSNVVGPIAALAGELSEIVTPVDGWNSAYNPEDAQVGRLRETSAALRARREAEVAGSGNTTVDAIRANVLRVNEGSEDPEHQPPTAVKVFFNDTDFYDANGLPPHSCEVLVQEGTDQDIAQAVWDSVGAGTATVGNQTSSVVDSEGVTQTVRWSRPTEVPMYAWIFASFDPSVWPEGVGGATAAETVGQYVLSAFLTYTLYPTIGKDVRQSPLVAAILRGGAEIDEDGAAIVPASAGAPVIPGLIEISQLLFGTSNPATDEAQVSIGPREIAVFDEARTTLTVTSEEP